MLDWVKVSMMAKELGLSDKTIYNWIADGKLKMVRPGFVSHLEAYETWLHQKSLKSGLAIERARQGTKRDSYGRFIHIPKTGE